MITAENKILNATLLAEFEAGSRQADVAAHHKMTLATVRRRIAQARWRRENDAAIAKMAARAGMTVEQYQSARAAKTAAFWDKINADNDTYRAARKAALKAELKAKIKALRQQYR